MAHSSGAGRDRTPQLHRHRRRAVARSAAAAIAAVALLTLAPAAADPTIPAQARTGNPHGKPPKGPPHLDPAASASADDAGLPFGMPEDPEQAEREFEDIKVKAARIARAKNQRNALRDKVSAMLKGGPMDPALKQELVTHARRIARLERAKRLAADHKDAAGSDRAAKLIGMENTRHEKWLSDYDARTAKGASK